MAPSQASPSTEVAIRSSADLAAVEELERILLTGEGAALNVENDPEAARLELMQQLLSSNSDEELFGVFGNAQGWRELLGVPIELAGFNWRPSQFEGEGGMAVFFVVRGTRLDDGAKVVLTTGSGTVLAQLTNLAKRGELIGKVVVLEEGTSRTEGRKPLQLRPAKAADETEAPF